MPRRRIRERITRTEQEVSGALGDAYKPTRDPHLAEQRAAERRRLAAEARERMPAFTRCQIRGCQVSVLQKTDLSLCVTHAVQAWEAVETMDAESRTGVAVNTERARREVIRAQSRASMKIEADEWLRSPATVGEIYYVRVGDLIKVGWTTDLYGRVHRYGAGATLLAHYPGTRQDEKNLHRQLKPSLARGREWYSEDQIVQDFIAQALTEHGPPDFAQAGFRPAKKTVAAKRVGRTLA